MKVFIYIAFYLFFSLIQYVSITTIIDAVIMGVLRPRFSLTCHKKEYLVKKENRMDFQSGNACAAYSAAFVLRHWNIDKDAEGLYASMTGKRSDGTVSPKGLQKLLSLNGLTVKYCTGNINALKNEISRGNPTIVLVRTQTAKNNLHYLPVVGYDENNLFVAESLKDYVNCPQPYCNRKIPTEEFKKLWNTSMAKMPLYKNTFLSVDKQE